MRSPSCHGTLRVPQYLMPEVENVTYRNMVLNLKNMAKRRYRRYSIVNVYL